MTEDEKAAEAYAQKHNDPKIDWDVMTQEQTQALLERVSCDGCRHNFKALSLAFLAGVEHARPRWIPVGERLPEPDELVWTFSSDKKSSYGKMIRNGYWEVLRDGMEWLEVTHWLPFPQEPKV